MPIFGRQKDRELIKHFNNEVLQNILDTPVMIFKPYVNMTNTNLYGESPTGKRWKTGVKIYATVNTEDQEWGNSDFGLDVNQKVVFSFLNEHIWSINTGGASEEDAFIIDPGDIVMYDSQYWEIDTTVRNEYLFGRNQYTTDVFDNDDNGSEGESLSTVAEAHLTRRSRLNIEHPAQLRSLGQTTTVEKDQVLYR